MKVGDIIPGLGRIVAMGISIHKDEKGMPVECAWVSVVSV